MNLQVRSVPLLLIPLLFFSLLFVRNVSADPIPDPTVDDWFSPVFLLTLLAFFSLLETGIINIFLSRKENMGFRVLLSIFTFFMNISTMLLVSSLMFLTREYPYSTDILFYIIVEIGVVLIEFISLYWFFIYANRNGRSCGNYSARYILMMAIVSNVVSFTVELLLSRFLTASNGLQ